MVKSRHRIAPEDSEWKKISESKLKMSASLSDFTERTGNENNHVKVGKMAPSIRRFQEVPAIWDNDIPCHLACCRHANVSRCG